MHIIKLDPLTYPYSLYDLQLDFPNVSFPTNLQEVEDLSQYGCAWVNVPDHPEHDSATQTVIEGEPELVDGEWYLTYTIRDLVKEEIIERTPSQWDSFRKEFLLDQAYNFSLEECMVDYPAIAINLCALLSSIDDTKVFAFKDAFYLFCDKAQVSPVDRDIWASIGENFFLPTYFIDILRGYA